MRIPKNVLHVNVGAKLPSMGDHAWLFHMRIGGYSISAWETGNLSADRTRSVCGIVATKKGKVVFLADDWSPSPMWSRDGKEARSDAVGWVAHYLGDESLDMARHQRFGDE